MRTDDFDFDLPKSAIAQRPLRPRDAARLLVVGRELEDKQVRNLPEVLRPDDVLVFNDTRVIPARLSGRRGGAKVEVTLLETTGEGRWRAFARPAKRLKPEDLNRLRPGLLRPGGRQGRGRRRHATIWPHRGGSARRLGRIRRYAPAALHSPRGRRRPPGS